MQKQSRNYQLDIIRIIACLMVITMHAPQPGIGLSGLFCGILNFFTLPCIGLFFMVSGTLLLPVKLSYKEFVRKRLTKVIWPLLFFSLFYIVISCVSPLNGGGKIITFKHILTSILSIPFSPQGTGILWFMYPLIGVYFLAPITTLFFEKCSKREFQFILLLWFISLSLGSLSNYLNVRMDETGIYYSFGGYAGYFLLGYYLKRFPIRIKSFVLPFLIIIPFVIQILNHQHYCNLNTGYLSVFCVMQCIAWYQLIMQYVKTESWSVKTKEDVESVSNCGFGIYLIHPFILYKVMWDMSLLINYPYIRNFVVIVMTFILSLAISLLLSRTRLGTYIIGYRKSNKVCK